MRVSLTHRFDCDPKTLWDVFDSDAFEERLAEGTGVVRTLLSHSDEGGISMRRRGTRLAQELPGVVKRVLGSDTLEWVEVATLDRNRNRLEWSIELPAAIANRVDIHGVTRVRADGDQTVRTITGEIKVRIPLVGDTVAGIAAKQLSESYETAAVIARDLLAQRDRSAT